MKKADLVMFLKAKIQILLKNNYSFRGYIKEIKEDCLIFEDQRDGPMLIPFDDIRYVKFYTDEEADKSG
jgi:ribosome maturation factor RimP